MLKKRVSYFDALNVVSCIAVVAMHVNGTSLYTFQHSVSWLSSLFIDCLCYFAVPVFFMLTGATLMDYRKRYNTYEFIKKRFSRTMIPFLFWSVVAIVWCVLALKCLKWSDVSSPIKLINVIFNVRAFNIYYFFIDLFAVYLCIPVLGIIPSQKRIGKKGVFTYLILYTFLSRSLLPVLFLIIGIDWNQSLNNPLGGGYIIFVLLGYYLANTQIELKVRRVIYLFGAIALFFQFGSTAYLSFRDNSINAMYRGYTNFPAVIYAVAIFTAFKYFKWENYEKLNSTIIKLSGASFGVYLIHKYPIYVLCYIFSINEFSTAWRIGGIFLTYGLSVIIVKLLQKIPYVNKLIP